MKKGNRELKAYESIIHNLLSLKEDAINIRPKEVKAIGAIIQSLFNLSGSFPTPLTDIYQANDTDTRKSNDSGKVLVHSH